MSAYGCFADVYDTLTSNIDYKELAGYYDRIIASHGGKRGILLDLACGTGSMSMQFSALGYDVIGVDLSTEMLSVAKEEADAMEDGLQTKIGSSGIRLSGGQAQRLSLARTLCHKRPLLILDDPFSALDRNTEQEIFKNLQKETENGIVLLISHRLYLFPKLSKVIWMEQGNTVVASHEELLKEVPEYRRLFEDQEGDVQDEA